MGKVTGVIPGVLEFCERSSHSYMMYLPFLSMYSPFFSCMFRTITGRRGPGFEARIQCVSGTGLCHTGLMTLRWHL